MNKPETLIDGYKVDHRRQYPDNTELVMSNFTPRKSRRNFEKAVFFGLQYFIKEYLVEQWNKDFFEQDIEKIVTRFSRRINNYLGPNGVGDKHIRELHSLGYLPLCIYALPEGTVYNMRVPSLVVFTTDKRFGWLTNYIETIMSTTLWGPCTSATTAFEYKKILNKFAMETVGNTNFVQFQGHDFSFRGMYGLEAAKLSGAAHLTSFVGTDTIPAIDFLEKYYNADCEKEMIGVSVAATEHSVMCAGGEEDEIETYRRLINEIYPSGIVSIVSDTWDYWNVITNTSKILKSDILKRDGKVVFRPDTGDPVKIVTGWLDEEIARTNTDGVFCDPKTWDILSHAEIKGSIECLWEIFGGTINEKGYKELNSKVGLIYGDSITLERAQAICERLKKKGFASTNIVYGIGSFTYQYVTRDTEGYAVKATYAEINGKPKEIYKNPKTDDGTKKSAKGITYVIKDESNNFILKDQGTWSDLENCELKKVFENGKLLIDYSLEQVRENLKNYL